MNEKKISADGANERLNTLKLMDFTDIDISKYFIIAASWLFVAS